MPVRRFVRCVVRCSALTKRSRRLQWQCVRVTSIDPVVPGSKLDWTDMQCLTPNNSISHRWHACRSGTPFLGPRRFIRATTRVHQTTTWAGAWLHASRPRGAQCGKKGEATNPASLFFFYLLSSLIAYCSIRPTKKALYYILKGGKKQSTLLQVKRATRQSCEHDE